MLDGNPYGVLPEQLIRQNVKKYRFLHFTVIIAKTLQLKLLMSARRHGSHELYS